MQESLWMQYFDFLSYSNPDGIQYQKQLMGFIKIVHQETQILIRYKITINTYITFLPSKTNKILLSSSIMIVKSIVYDVAIISMCVIWTGPNALYRVLEIYPTSIQRNTIVRRGILLYLNVFLFPLFCSIISL